MEFVENIHNIIFCTVVFLRKFSSWLKSLNCTYHKQLLKKAKENFVYE